MPKPKLNFHEFECVALAPFADDPDFVVLSFEHPTEPKLVSMTLNVHRSILKDFDWGWFSDELPVELV